MQILHIINEWAIGIFAYLKHHLFAQSEAFDELFTFTDLRNFVMTVLIFLEDFFFLYVQPFQQLAFILCKQVHNFPEPRLLIKGLLVWVDVSVPEFLKYSHAFAPPHSKRATPHRSFPIQSRSLVFSVVIRLFLFRAIFRTSCSNNIYHRNGRKSRDIPKIILRHD